MQLEISGHFLKSMCKITPTAIKIYLSLAYHSKKKNNKTIQVSHGEILINYFDDESYYSDFLSVSGDYNSFLRGLKELEEHKIIKVKRSKTPNGKPLTNIYTLL